MDVMLKVQFLEHFFRSFSFRDIFQLYVMWIHCIQTENMEKSERDLKKMLGLFFRPNISDR